MGQRGRHAGPSNSENATDIIRPGRTPEQDRQIPDRGRTSSGILTCFQSPSRVPSSSQNLPWFWAQIGSQLKLLDERGVCLTSGKHSREDGQHYRLHPGWSDYSTTDPTAPNGTRFAQWKSSSSAVPFRRGVEGSRVARRRESYLLEGFLVRISAADTDRRHGRVRKNAGELDGRMEYSSSRLP